jgi:hypothetical protein
MGSVSSTDQALGMLKNAHQFATFYRFVDGALFGATVLALVRACP